MRLGQFLMSKLMSSRGSNVSEVFIHDRHFTEGGVRGSHDVVWCDVIRDHVMQCDVIRDHMMQCNVIMNHGCQKGIIYHGVCVYGNLAGRHTTLQWCYYGRHLHPQNLPSCELTLTPMVATKDLVDDGSGLRESVQLWRVALETALL